MLPSTTPTYTRDPHADTDAATDQLYQELLHIVRRNYNAPYLRMLIRCALARERIVQLQ